MAGRLRAGHRDPDGRPPRRPERDPVRGRRRQASFRSAPSSAAFRGGRRRRITTPGCSRPERWSRPFSAARCISGEPSRATGRTVETEAILRSGPDGIVLTDRRRGRGAALHRPARDPGLSRGAGRPVGQADARDPDRERGAGARHPSPLLSRRPVRLAGQLRRPARARRADRRPVRLAHPRQRQ